MKKCNASPKKRRPMEGRPSAIRERPKPVYRFPKSYPKTLCDQIKKARESRGMTQEEVAELVGCSPRYYNDIEARYRMPRFDMLLRIVCVVGCSIDSIYMKK